MSENGTTPKITPRQQKGITALLTKGTVRAASQETGISERQFYRWLAEDTFKQAVQDASDDMLAESVRALKGGNSLAVDALRKILEDPQVKPNVKRAAADSWLGHTLRMTELAEISRRLSELERLQNAKP